MFMLPIAILILVVSVGVVIYQLSREKHHKIHGGRSTWSTEHCIYLALIFFILGVIIFGLAYDGMGRHTGIGSFDGPVLLWMVGHREAQITFAMQIITLIANPISFVSIVFLSSSIWAIRKKEIWRPALLAGSVGVTALISTFVKLATNNERPIQIDMVVPFETGYSFPSGHTICMLVYLLVIGYLIYSRYSSVKRISSWVVITIVDVGIIATSRLYLGYHWLTDILASIGLGFILFGFVIIIDRFALQRFKKLK